MTDRPSRISTDIDFEWEGRQVSYLRLPYSSNVSAYGWIGLPFAQIKNGRGPTVLFMAGNHGDEYEGQIVLTKLIRDLDPDAVRGRVMILPAANFPAATAGTRVSPIDDGNLNRLFPGNPDSTPSPMIAHYIDSVLLPQCQAVVDLHAGGRTLHYLPSFLARLPEDAGERQRTIAALVATGAPRAYLTESREDRTLIATANRRGVLAIGAELGGSGTVTPQTIAVTERGVRNLMRHLGLVADGAFPTELEGPPTRLMRVEGRHFVYAPDRGLFEPAFDLGDGVNAGQLAGQVHFIDDPERPPRAVHFGSDGIVICRRTPTAVERGDCVAHLAEDYVP